MSHVYENKTYQAETMARCLPVIKEFEKSEQIRGIKHFPSALYGKSEKNKYTPWKKKGTNF